MLNILKLQKIEYLGYCIEIERINGKIDCKFRMKKEKLDNIKIIVGFSGCVGGMEFFLQHGNDPVETALDISFVSGSEPGAGHHF